MPRRFATTISEIRRSMCRAYRRWLPTERVETISPSRS
jgi:hypothetical protein